MIINLWYNQKMKEWRWSLTETGIMTQHSGGQEELRDAMNDVANTVEYILDNELKRRVIYKVCEGSARRVTALSVALFSYDK